MLNIWEIEILFIQKNNMKERLKKVFRWLVKHRRFTYLDISVLCIAFNIMGTNFGLWVMFAFFGAFLSSYIEDKIYPVI